MKRILVVDDNTEYLQVLSNVLSNDFDTIKATGVKDALDILQAITVDAICSDYNMKDGTGLELLEDIRQKGINVPFLLMSGDDDYLLEQKAKLCGGVFCSKTDCDLIGKIKELINSET
ncbi:response regulator [Mediterraneibacter sp. NSJ-151]|jgi:DNA-binding NtrC family response regulator|nr:response regulator [Mediterraneibacter sp. NSJ-151]MCH4280811.1 response regulator [Mediterraneibacter sp. NSJ-151]